jgi:hypothetical protein
MSTDVGIVGDLGDENCFISKVSDLLESQLIVGVRREDFEYYQKFYKLREPWGRLIHRSH